MMNKKFSKTEMKGLPGGPNEQFTYVTGVFLQDMYHVPIAQKGLEKYQIQQDNTAVKPINIIKPGEKVKKKGEYDPNSPWSNIANILKYQAGQTAQIIADNTIVPVVKSAIDIVSNPKKYVEKVKDFAGDVADAYTVGTSGRTDNVKFKEGYGKELMDIANVFPLAAGAKQGITLGAKALTNGPLKNFSKYNPLGFKPNPEAVIKNKNLLEFLDKDPKALEKIGLKSKIAEGADAKVYDFIDDQDKLLRIGSSNPEKLIKAGKNFWVDQYLGLPTFMQNANNKYATLMNKVPGTSLKGMVRKFSGNPSIDQVIPRKSIAEAALKLRELKKKNIFLDWQGDNITYDPITKKIGFYDFDHIPMQGLQTKLKKQAGEDLDFYETMMEAQNVKRRNKENYFTELYNLAENLIIPKKEIGGGLQIQNKQQGGALEKYQTKGEFNFNDLISKYQKSGWESLTKDEQDLYRDNYDNLYYDEKQKSWLSDKPVAQVTGDATGRYKELGDYRNWLTDWYSSDIAKNMMTEGYRKEYEGTDYEGSVDPRQLAQENLQERIKNISGRKKLEKIDPNDNINAWGYVWAQSDNLFEPLARENEFYKKEDFWGELNKKYKDRESNIFKVSEANKVRSDLYKKAYRNTLEKEADESLNQYDKTFYPQEIKKQTRKLEEFDHTYRTIYYDPKTDEYTIPHELGHLSTGSLNLIPNQDIRLIQEEMPYLYKGDTRTIESDAFGPFVYDAPMRNKLIQRYGPKDYFGNPINKENYGKLNKEQLGFFRSLPYDYYDSPTEVQTRLNVARYQAKDKIGWDPLKRKATMEDVIKLREVDEDNIQELFKNYSPDHILKMLNSVAMEDQGQDMYYGQNGLEKKQDKSKREFIKYYNDKNIKYLKDTQDKNPRFRNLSPDELQQFSALNDYEIFTSSLGQNIPLGRNRRFGIQWDDGDEYTEIPKDNPLWKEIYKENKKDYKLENLINRLKKKEYTGKRDYKLTPAILNELEYLQSLKEGDKDFFRKEDTDVLENIIKKEYNIDNSKNPLDLRKRKKFIRSPFDYALELSKNYISNNNELPFIKQKGGEGYRINAPNYNDPYKVIPSGNITMTEQDGGPLKKGPLLGIDNLGNQQMMFPGYNYVFPGDMVMEIPVAQEGNGEKKAQYLNSEVFDDLKEQSKKSTGVIEQAEEVTLPNRILNAMAQPMTYRANKNQGINSPYVIGLNPFDIALAYVNPTVAFKTGKNAIEETAKGNYGNALLNAAYTASYLPYLKALPLKQKGGTSWTDYLNPFNWGAKNMDDAGDFQTAFRTARGAGYDDFMWQGDRYSTELSEQPNYEKLFYDKSLLDNLSDKQKQRREALLYNADLIAKSQGDNEDLRRMLIMTAAMENSLGADPNAYGRDYTRGPMSIDNIAWRDVFDVREGANNYTAQQKKNEKWLNSLGLDMNNLETLLRSDDPLASMAVARLVYGRIPEALPSGDDPKAMFDYYLNYYNRKGLLKHGTPEQHYARFLKDYNRIYKKSGGEFQRLVDKYTTKGWNSLTDTEKQEYKNYYNNM